jgi:F0F1-type ATP synthase membrane subunit b/b'
MNKKSGGASKEKSNPGKRFITKKEKEAQDAKKQREKLKKERDRRLKELEKEIDDMKQFVKETIKEPTTKRRNSITSFVEHLPLDEQNIPI